MGMQTMSVRFDDEVRWLLKEGQRRTPLTKQELVRRTLRQHLRSVIEQEASTPAKRVTNVEPWPHGALARAYKRTGHEEWDKVEAAAAAAQPLPSMED
jgi:aminopeptidase N